MTCNPEGQCWCAELPPVIAVPEREGAGCLCRECLLERIASQRGMNAAERVEK